MRELEIELGRTPVETEIAQRLGMSVGSYRTRLQAASVVTVSLEESDPRNDDDDAGGLARTAVDPNAIDPEEAILQRDAVERLTREIRRLPERQRLILSLYYQDGLTFKEVGQVLGVTESRVSQIHTETVLVLRSRLLDPDVLARLGRRRTRR
jgi:RNA polymerase sigma factor for flagellar operon FliA